MVSSGSRADVCLRGAAVRREGLRLPSGKHSIACGPWSHLPWGRWGTGGGVQGGCGQTARRSRGSSRRAPGLLARAHTPVLRPQVYAHAGAALDGKMYVTCGRRGEDYLKETHCYEPGSDTWHTLADGPVRRAWHGMATLLDKLYVIGGSNNDAGYRRDVHQVSGPPPSGVSEGPAMAVSGVRGRRGTRARLLVP